VARSAPQVKMGEQRLKRFTNLLKQQDNDDFSDTRVPVWGKDSVRRTSPSPLMVKQPR